MNSIWIHIKCFFGVHTWLFVSERKKYVLPVYSEPGFCNTYFGTNVYLCKCCLVEATRKNPVLNVETVT